MMFLIDMAGLLVIRCFIPMHLGQTSVDAMTG